MPLTTQKDGASQPTGPAGSLPVQGSHWSSGQDLKSKTRQLYDVLGPCFLRLDDGRTCVLSAEALQIIEIPLCHTGASN